MPSVKLRNHFFSDLERLEGYLEKIDKKISNTTGSFNHIYYVEFVEDKNFDAVSVDEKTEHITFIDSEKGSVNLYLCEITPEIAASKNTISSRDAYFNIRLKTSGYNLKLMEHVEISVNSKECEVTQEGEDYVIKMSSPAVVMNGENQTFEYNVAIKNAATNGRLEMIGDNDRYYYWLNGTKLRLNVTRSFYPEITVTIK